MIILVAVMVIVVLTMVTMVVVCDFEKAGLVKICVNVACWEKVIGREKLPRAQRISRARGLTGQIFNRQPLLHHHHHHSDHITEIMRRIIFEVSRCQCWNSPLSLCWHKSDQIGTRYDWNICICVLFVFVFVFAFAFIFVFGESRSSCKMEHDMAKIGESNSLKKMGKQWKQQIPESPRPFIKHFVLGLKYEVRLGLTEIKIGK